MKEAYVAAMMKIRDFAESAYPGNLPVGYPAIKFTRPDQGNWLEVYFIQNQAVDQSINGAGLDLGFVQVWACGRADSQLLPIMDLAHKLQDNFKVGDALGGAKINKRAQVGSLVVGSDFIYIPVRIFWEKGYVE